MRCHVCKEAKEVYYSCFYCGSTRQLPSVIGFIDAARDLFGRHLNATECLDALRRASHGGKS